MKNSNNNPDAFRLLNIFFILIILAVLSVYFMSCRSNRESALNCVESVNSASTVQSQKFSFEERIRSFSNSLSFDSLELLIQRNWIFPDLSVNPSDSISDGLAFSFGNCRTDSVGQPIYPAIHSFPIDKGRPLLLSESVSLRAKGINSDVSSEIKDSLSVSELNSATDDFSGSANLSSSESSQSVRVFDPPDSGKVIIFSVLFATACIFIVWCFKRKS